MSKASGFFYPNAKYDKSTIKTSSMADEEEETLQYDPFANPEMKRKYTPSGDNVGGHYVSYTTVNPIHEEFRSDDPVRHYNRNHPPYAPGKLTNEEINSLYEYERQHEENIKELRNTPEYRFFELVSGTMNRLTSDIAGSSRESHEKAYAKLTGTPSIGTIPTVMPPIPSTPFSTSSISSVRNSGSSFLSSGAPPIGEKYIPRNVSPKDFKNEQIRNIYERQMHGSILEHSDINQRRREQEERRELMILEKKRLESTQRMGIIKLNPIIYQATLQAKVILDRRVSNLRGAKIEEHYIRCDDDMILSQFANLVGCNALKASNLSPKRWQLDALYKRIRKEIDDIVNWFKYSVKFNGTKLFITYTSSSSDSKGSKALMEFYRGLSNDFFAYRSNFLDNVKNPVHSLRD